MRRVGLVLLAVLFALSLFPAFASASATGEVGVTKDYLPVTQIASDAGLELVKYWPRVYAVLGQQNGGRAVLVAAGPAAARILEAWRPVVEAGGKSWQIVARVAGAVINDTLCAPVRDVAAGLDLPPELFAEPPKGPPVIFAARSRYYLVGGQVKVARVAPYATREGLWLPLRELAVALGLGVAWDETAKAPKVFSSAGSLTLKNARIIGGCAMVGPEGWKAVARLAGKQYWWIDNGHVPLYDRSGLLGAGPGIGFD